MMSIQKTTGSKSMDNAQLLDIAKDQLNRVLGFFPRTEAKASVVLAVDTGMLALLAINAPPIRLLDWYMLFAVIPVLLITISIVHLYWGAFPQLTGGHQSLVYFREIANRTESKFIEEFKAQQLDAYINDLLGQIWRNSEILKEKFDHLKWAFTFLALALIPWLIALAMFAAKNTAATSLLVK
jgi:hypothetical protein